MKRKIEATKCKDGYLVEYTTTIIYTGYTYQQLIQEIYEENLKIEYRDEDDKKIIATNNKIW